MEQKKAREGRGRSTPGKESADGGKLTGCSLAAQGLAMANLVGWLGDRCGEVG